LLPYFPRFARSQFGLAFAGIWSFTMGFDHRKNMAVKSIVFFFTSIAWKEFLCTISSSPWHLSIIVWQNFRKHIVYVSFHDSTFNLFLQGGRRTIKQSVETINFFLFRIRVVFSGRTHLTFISSNRRILINAMAKGWKWKSHAISVDWNAQPDLRYEG
jgi:hypothetical protein